MLVDVDSSMTFPFFRGAIFKSQYECRRTVGLRGDRPAGKGDYGLALL